MAFLNEPQIEKIVKKALKEVADFTGDIKNYEFKHFHEFHKKIFIAKLKGYINEGPYYDRAGNSDYERYYDIGLSMGLINSWKTIKDCIGYIVDHHTVKKRNPNKIQF